jgi:hypothetical protein
MPPADGGQPHIPADDTPPPDAPLPVSEDQNTPTQPRANSGPTDAGGATDAPAASASAANTPSDRCAHCGQPLPPHTRRCPHCGQPVGAQPISRPPRQFAGEAGAPWQEAAERVTELGALDWETGVHPLNEDTHPIPDPLVPPDLVTAQLGSEATPVPRRASRGRHGPLWLAFIAGILVMVTAIFLLIVLPYVNSSSNAASIAAAATHAADQAAHATAQAVGSDPFGTPTPVPPPYGPAGAATSTPSPGGHPTVTPIPTPTPPTATPTPSPPQLVLAINSGGGQVGSFNADMDVQGGNTYSTDHHIDTSGVTNPAPEQVYQSERWGIFTYTVSNLQAGSYYTVRLHFAEIYFSQPGQRVFNVAIQGKPVLTDFDIIAQAGKAYSAIIEAFTVAADSNGDITISFTAGPANWPKLSGLEIYTAPGGGAAGG